MWLFKRLFKKDAPAWVLYIPAIMGVLLCFLIFHQHTFGDATTSLVTALISSAFVLVPISLSLRRFIGTVQKPYQKGNIHAALGSVFATVVMFAVIYSYLYLYLPGSFAGLDGKTPLDQTVNVIYFSTTIIATVGFGDIHAVGSVAKVFVTIEMMSFFMFFVVILGASRSFIKPRDDATESVAPVDARSSDEA